MNASSEEVTPNQADWTIQGAEDLLGSLPGVISVRIVGRPGGRIDEVHLLTTEEVSPKQTVRNVESALKAHYHLEVDHRTISVARTSEPPPEPPPEPPSAPEIPDVSLPAMPFLMDDEAEESARILFQRHQIESSEGHRVRASVTLEWHGREFQGEAMGADLPRARLENVAQATLEALEGMLNLEEPGDTRPGVTFALDGVKVVDAFDRRFVLVAVNAIEGRNVAVLSGASALGDSADRSVILATLQATDRWARGRL